VIIPAEQHRAMLAVAVSPHDGTNVWSCGLLTEPSVAGEDQMHLASLGNTKLKYEVFIAFALPIKLKNTKSNHPKLGTILCGYKKISYRGHKITSA
jgi:hypothetical protein